jgi:pyruvate, water dikinase
MRLRSASRSQLLLGLLLAALTLAPRAARGGVVASVEPSRILAGTAYDGATLQVEGSVGEHSHVAIRVMGPPEHHVFNRRDKIAGFMWAGVEHVTFHNAPSLYAVFTSAALFSMADQKERTRLRLGYDTLEAGMEVEGTSVAKDLMVEQFVHLKEHEGLYSLAPGAVHLTDPVDGRRSFHVAVPIPAAEPPGDIEVAVFELTDGVAGDSRIVHVPLAWVGMPGYLHTLAHQNGTVYGFLAVIIALVTGFATDLVGSLQSPERRRNTVRLFEGLGREIRAIVPGLRPPLRSPEEVERLHAKYLIFRNLLDVNNEVLALLTELEEESSWTSFRHPRVRMGIRALFDGTADMVGLLNRLSGNRYFDLVNVVAGIRRDVSEFLTDVPEAESVPLTLAMEEISSKTAGYVGGKAVNLARLSYDSKMRVPAFFVVTTEAYRVFLEFGGLASKLRTVLAPARLDAPEDFRRRCELAQGLVDESPVPEAVIESIRRAYRALALSTGEGVAVRSSASGEDSDLSFAGQFESLLNVPENGLIDAWKRVVRSRFAPGAVFYRRAAGLAEVDTSMAVLVQRMVRARASGVLFTRRPEQARSAVILLTATHGLGADVSTGIAYADEFVVGRPPRRILERRIARKARRLVSGEHGGIAPLPIEGEEQLQPALSDEEVLKLAESSLVIERYFGGAQDIEWALDEAGEVWILQARPLRTEKAETQFEAPPDAPLLLRGGQAAWPGCAVGPVHLVRSRADEDRLPTGAILVVPQLLPDCVRLLPRVCGILVERGTVTGHSASIVREFRVPCLFGISGVVETLVDGQVISLDAANGAVYAGALWPNLRGRLPVTLLGRRVLGLPTVLAGKLTKLSGSSFLSSWTCQSLHDVIRYAHEMAIQYMFGIGDRLSGSVIGGIKRLESSQPIYLHILDLGGGIRPEATAQRSVKPEDVRSVPFQGIWRGLSDEGLVQRRLGEPGVGAFAAVMMSTAVGGAVRAFDAPNYACITDSYMNLNSRQAYHFAIVDAFLCDNENSNHISIRLKGGGAAPWQRGLRAEFMAEVLRLHLFTANVQGDLLNAWRRGIDIATGIDKLTVLGHLLRFSAQLDMWIDDESKVKRYVEAFIEAEGAALLASVDQANQGRDATPRAAP